MGFRHFSLKLAVNWLKIGCILNWSDNPMNMKLSPKLKTSHLEWLLHIGIWTFFIAERWFNHHPNPVQHTIIIVFTIIPLYVNILYLIPQYFKRKKWLTYIVYLVGSIVLANFMRSACLLLYFHFSSSPIEFQNDFLHWAFLEFRSYDKFIFSTNTWIVYLSFTHMFVRDWIVSDRVRRKLESEKLSMELAFLKSQIDPHFLFNTLNSLYAMALNEGAQKTSDALTKMGALMRYNLHDSQADKILLSREIDYLEKYIELQKLRISRDALTHIRIDFQTQNVRDQGIAPMMLLPFIENAFKYGVSTIHETFIEISLRISGSILKLNVKNTDAGKTVSDEGGIGLQNVKSRLRLLYPKRHNLSIHSNNEYDVSLEIDLS